MSCGIGCRLSSDPGLLWLWRRPAATGPVQPLAWEPPYATGAAPEKGKKTKKKKKKKGGAGLAGRRGWVPRAGGSLGAGTSLRIHQHRHDRPWASGPRGGRSGWQGAVVLEDKEAAGRRSCPLTPGVAACPQERGPLLGPAFRKPGLREGRGSGCVLTGPVRMDVGGPGFAWMER